MVAGWRMAGKALHQRVAAVRMMFSMWLTEDVVAKRADHLTDAESKLGAHMNFSTPAPTIGFGNQPPLPAGNHTLTPNPLGDGDLCGDFIIFL